MIENKDILQVLRNINHPETGQDIVSMGMVDDIKLNGKDLSFSLRLKKQNDPFISGIKKVCVQAIEAAFGSDINIKGNIQVIVPESKSQPKTEVQSTLSEVKNVIAVASGKGGVGKSTVAVNLAIALAKTGAKVGLIDADIFGPSLPKMFGVEDMRPRVRKVGETDFIEPVEKYGVKMLSIGFFVNPEDALVWRGPMATSALKQLLHQGEWGELDYLMIDMPPGTSDIHLTLVQEVAVTGAVVVSTPQDVALADAVKGIKMFATKGIEVPVLGLVENMAWFTPEELPNNKYYIFGKGGVQELAKKQDLPVLGEIPIVQGIREGGDTGNPAVLNDGSMTSSAFIKLAESVLEQVEKRNVELEPTKRVEIKHK